MCVWQSVQSHEGHCRVKWVGMKFCLQCLCVAENGPRLEVFILGRILRSPQPQRTDAFKWRYWKRLLRVPWTTRKSNQSILKEINPGYSLEGLMLKLKLQYFGHLMQRADSLEKTVTLERLKAGGEKGDQGWDGWMASLTEWTWLWASSMRQWRTGKLGVLQFMGSQGVGYDWVIEQQQSNLE